MIDTATAVLPRSDERAAFEQTIRFPDGLLGFPDANEYHLAEGPAEGLFWLVSASGEASFLVSDPFVFFEGYTLDLTPYQARRIDADETTDVGVLAITVPNADEPWTANLQGPVVINVEKSIGAQLVLPGSDPGVRRPFSPGI